MYKILFICHGNICRSPMAEFIMKKLAKEGMHDIYVESAATSLEEIDNPIYPPVAKMLKEKCIDGFDKKRARRVTKDDYDKFDLLLAMDEENINGLKRIIPDDPENKIHKILEYVGAGDDIEDPWYTRDFEKVYNLLNISCTMLLNKIVIEKIKKKNNK